MSTTNVKINSINAFFKSFPTCRINHCSKPFFKFFHHTTLSINVRWFYYIIIIISDHFILVVPLESVFFPPMTAKFKTSFVHFPSVLICLCVSNWCHLFVARFSLRDI